MDSSNGHFIKKRRRDRFILIELEIIFQLRKASEIDDILEWMSDIDWYCIERIDIKLKLFSWIIYPSSFVLCILFIMNIRNVIHWKWNFNSVYSFLIKLVGKYVSFFEVFFDNDWWRKLYKMMKIHIYLKRNIK